MTPLRTHTLNDGFPLFYIGHRDILCAGCATKAGLKAYEEDHPENGMNCGVNYTDQALRCDDCDVSIGVAFGPDDKGDWS